MSGHQSNWPLSRASACGQQVQTRASEHSAPACLPGCGLTACLPLGQAVDVMSTRRADDRWRRRRIPSQTGRIIFSRDNVISPAGSAWQFVLWMDTYLYWLGLAARRWADMYSTPVATTDTAAGDMARAGAWRMCMVAWLRFKLFVTDHRWRFCRRYSVITFAGHDKFTWQVQH